MGRQKINQWTRYLTVGLACIQTSFVAHWLQVNGVGAPTWGFLFTTVLTLTTGLCSSCGWANRSLIAASVMDLAAYFRRHRDWIATRGEQVFERVRGGDTLETLGVIGLLVAIVAIIAFIVFVEAARRRIPVSYAKRHVGRQVVGGHKLPCRSRSTWVALFRLFLLRPFFQCPRVCLRHFP